MRVDNPYPLMNTLAVDDHRMERVTFIEVRVGIVTLGPRENGGPEAWRGAGPVPQGTVLPLGFGMQLASHGCLGWARVRG